MQIKIQLFGAFRKYGNQVEITLPHNSMIADLRIKLLELLPNKALLEISRFANDTTILSEDYPLNEQDNLAILPPVSGG